jgi:hypothetical protein
MTVIRSHAPTAACAAVVVFAANLSSWAAEPSLVGNWKLVSYVAQELATGKKTPLLGEHPKGYLMFTPEGRMMALFVHETRSPPKTDEDRINLHKYMVAYSARYTVEGDKVVNHVDISWNEGYTGTDLVRFFKLEDNTLTIKTAPAKNPISGIESTTVGVFERER